MGHKEIAFVISPCDLHEALGREDSDYEVVCIL